MKLVEIIVKLEYMIVEVFQFMHFAIVRLIFEMVLICSRDTCVRSKFSVIPKNACSVERCQRNRARVDYCSGVDCDRTIPTVFRLQYRVDISLHRVD